MLYSINELEELLAWSGEGISSSSSSPSSSPSEGGAWKSNTHALSLCKNMENKYTKWEFDFKRGKKYCYSDQATLQIISNQFRISPCYSWNNVARTSLSNLFISQNVNQLNEGLRRKWNCWRRIQMLNLRQHPNTKIPVFPMTTLKQDLATIQL